MYTRIFFATTSFYNKIKAKDNITYEKLKVNENSYQLHDVK